MDTPLPLSKKVDVRSYAQNVKINVEGGLRIGAHPQRPLRLHVVHLLAPFLPPGLT